MRTPIRICFTTIAACTLFAACDKGVDVPPEKDWTLQRVGWILGDGDGVSTLRREIPQQIIRNDTHEEYDITVSLLDGMEGVSEFRCDDPALFDEVCSASCHSIIVPSEEMLLSSDEWRYMASGTEAPFRLGESPLPFTTDIKSLYTIKPMSQYEIGGRVILKKLTATFRAEFEERTTRERMEICGSWSGTFFQSVEEEATISDIEE